MNEPSSLQGFEFSELLQMANSGEKFMYQYSGLQDDKGFIVFVTLPAIDFLEQSDDWFCDGTFLTAPNVFYQVYTIHASVDGVYFLLVYDLLPDKKIRELSENYSFPFRKLIKIKSNRPRSLDFYLKMIIYPEKWL